MQNNFPFFSWAAKIFNHFISILQENGDRVYCKSGMILSAAVVDTLSLWNSTEPNENFDFIFLQYLSIHIFGLKTLAVKQLDDTKTQFISDIFTNRVKNDEHRLASFQNIVDKVIDQSSHKLMKSDQD